MVVVVVVVCVVGEGVQNLVLWDSSHAFLFSQASWLSIKPKDIIHFASTTQLSEYLIFKSFLSSLIEMKAKTKQL